MNFLGDFGKTDNQKNQENPNEGNNNPSMMQAVFKSIADSSNKINIENNDINNKIFAINENININEISDDFNPYPTFDDHKKINNNNIVEEIKEVSEEDEEIPSPPEQVEKDEHIPVPEQAEENNTEQSGYNNNNYQGNNFNQMYQPQQNNQFINNNENNNLPPISINKNQNFLNEYNNNFSENSANKYSSTKESNLNNHPNNQNINNDEYEIVKISYIDENNQRRYLEKLVPKEITSQHQSKLVSRNDLSNNISKNVSRNISKNVSRNISKNVSRNISRNVSKNVSRNASQNNIYNKNPKFSNTEIPNVSSFVEHIVPIGINKKNWGTTWPDQQQRETNVYRLGNLALMSQNTPSKQTKESFENKKVRFQNEPWPLTQSLSEREEWDGKAFLENQGELFYFIDEIWESSISS